MDHDGIMALLSVPNPVEKRLALKSRLVQPYHLRHALQDADPHIRTLAAKHPALTKEMMHEILLGNDKELRDVVMARPDLDPDLLHIMADHPDHAADVASHPRTDDSIREHALNLELPDGVQDMHFDAMNKNIGFITFPLLGEGKIHTGPMGVPDKAAAKRRASYTGSTMGQGVMIANDRDNSPTLPQEAQISGFAVKHKPSVPTPETTQRYASSVLNNPVKTYQTASTIDASKKDKATHDHETQHGVFARLSHKYGHIASRRAIATALSRLPEHHRNHIKKLYEGTGNVMDDALVDPEESIAYMQNYLQSPDRRRKVHANLGLASKYDQQQSVNTARQAWNNLRRIAMSLRPEDVGVELRENRVKNWLKQLQKRESIPSDHLGFSVSFHELMSIAQFLTGREESLESIRRALLSTDGDPKEAVLLAYGLTSPENRKAFDNIKTLRLHKSEDVLKAPKSIEDLTGGDLAEVIDEAYKRKAVQAVHLGGKHSSGSYIVTDRENQNWLLKPGSGKKSPAKGVDQTKASQSRREAAFSALAQLMGIKQINDVHLMQIDGKEIAAIKMFPLDWVNLHRVMTEENRPNLATKSLEPYRRDGTLFKWAVLDYIAGNPDRHGNNLMVSSEDDGHKIGLIDHGSAFAGTEFDPGHDENSFVPYYLRAWGTGNFHLASVEDQLKRMPRISGVINDELAEWMRSISPADVNNILIKYGIDPGPVLKRLEKVQAVAGEASTYINRLWLARPEA